MEGPVLTLDRPELAGGHRSRSEESVLLLLRGNTLTDDPFEALAYVRNRARPYLRSSYEPQEITMCSLLPTPSIGSPKRTVARASG
jgi:hypothetical protein